jgi:S-adenosylmethionine:tRNA ribosyltransferase-isomerase
MSCEPPAGPYFKAKSSREPRSACSGNKNEMIRASDFDYPLDESLIAQQPLERRDESRLMVLDRATGRLGRRVFRELPAILRRGDLLVVNRTRVVPARFFCRRRSGAKIEGLFLRQRQPGEWEALLKGAGRCRLGEELVLEPPAGGNSPPACDASVKTSPQPAETCLRLEENLGAGDWRVAVSPRQEALAVLARYGATPLPPYIRRLGAAQDSLDRPRYQTVYATEPGAVAAPTAGLHFTPELLDRLGGSGIELAPLTLHVGPGTFLPVKVNDLSQHHMHSEWYDLPAGTADALEAARKDGRRIVAVGTTSLRVLETVAKMTGNGEQGTFSCGAGGDPVSPGRHNAAPFAARSGWTDLFVYPPHEFRSADALITNFHLPRSTLLMLVAAFASPGRTDGIETIRRAYAEAQRLRYRFYSYGDAMLIE